MPTQNSQSQKQLDRADDDEPARALLSTTPNQLDSLSSTEMLALLNAFTSADASKIASAEKRLETVSLSELIGFLSFVRKNRIDKFRNSAIVAVLANMASITVLLYSGILNARSLIVLLPCISGSAVITAGIFRTAETTKLCGKALSRFKDAECASELISALDIKDKDVQKAVRPTLIKVLPKLRASHARLISKANRRTLLRILQDRRMSVDEAQYVNRQLRLAILQALQQVGDRSFIPVVTALSDNQSRWKDQEITDAANECLPYLHQLAAEQAADKELLRGSDGASVAAAETLLRPVAAAFEVDGTELLRANRGTLE